MNPPFVSEDFLRARLALPFGRPLVAGQPYAKPYNKSISFGELPMVRNYMYGGMVQKEPLMK